MAREAQKLGRRIGNIERRVGALERESGPVEAGQNFLLNNSDTLQLNEKTDIIKFILCDDAFVPDHPEHGELDSSQYKLDYGYCDIEILQQENEYTFIGS